MKLKRTGPQRRAQTKSACFVVMSWRESSYALVEFEDSSNPPKKSSRYVSAAKLKKLRDDIDRHLAEMRGPKAGAK